MSASDSLEGRSALQAHGDQLDTELRLLRELPQVYLTEKCVFDRGNGRVANKRGAICTLLCCGQQLDQKCNKTACRTVVDAVRFLRAKVEESHGVGRCISSPQETMTLTATTDSGSAAPRHTDAFAAMMSRPVAQQQARRKLKAAEQLVETCTAQELDVQRRLREVSKQLHCF